MARALDSANINGQQCSILGNAYGSILMISIISKQLTIASREDILRDASFRITYQCITLSKSKQSDETNNIRALRLTPENSLNLSICCTLAMWQIRGIR